MSLYIGFKTSKQGLEFWKKRQKLKKQVTKEVIRNIALWVNYFLYGMNLGENIKEMEK